MGKCSSGKEKIVIQLVMESEKAEFNLEMGRKRKKMSGRSYGAQFKVQCIKTVDSGTDEEIEGPYAIMDAYSVVSENSTMLPGSRDGSVHSETVEECRDPMDINGVMVESEGLSVAVMDKSDGNCLEESCVNKLHTNLSSVKSLNSLQEASTCSARPHDCVVSESDVKCMRPEEARLFPESVNGSRPAIRKSACSNMKRISSGSTENDLCSYDCAVTKDMGQLCTCKKRVQHSKESLCKSNTDNTYVENKQIKLVNECVGPESAQVEGNGNQVTRVANRERGPSIIATCDKSQSSLVVKQDVNRGPCNARSAESVSSKLPDVQNEVELKSLSEEYCRSNTDNMIFELERKCRKRRKILQRKHQEKIQEFHKIWDEKREQLDKDNGLETAFIQYVFSEVSVRTERLQSLNEAYLCKIDNLKLMKDVELKNLEAEQLAAMNEEKQKAEGWLSTAMLCQR